MVVKEGWRPLRKNGEAYLPPRIEKDQDNSVGKVVVHNYGHGGAGVTLSWGSARRVSDILEHEIGVHKDKSVAVLGAGVIGLTTAASLRRRGYSVRIYAADVPGPTSQVAGGQFAASDVGKDSLSAQILNWSYQEFSSNRVAYGVQDRPNFTTRQAPHLLEASRLVAGRADLAHSDCQLSRLPFDEVVSGGYRYPLMLVEVPKFLSFVLQELKSRGVEIKSGYKFAGQESIHDLPETVVVNCLGVGSKDVWDDAYLQGGHGVLAWLPAQPRLRYLYSGIGYLFPRPDHLIVGGLIENEQLARQLDNHTKALLMVRLVRSVFQGALPTLPQINGGSSLTEASMIGLDDEAAQTQAGEP